MTPEFIRDALDEVAARVQQLMAMVRVQNERNLQLEQQGTVR